MKSFIFGKVKSSLAWSDRKERFAFFPIFHYLFKTMADLNSWEAMLQMASYKIPATYLRIYVNIWNIKVQSIVEIGVFKGRCSENLRKAFPDAFLYLIDPWKMYEEYSLEEAGPISEVAEDYERAYEHVSEIFKDDPKVKIIRKPSMEALDDVPDELDLVFIDGNHSYQHVKQDIENWLPKVRVGGILSGHDYDPGFPGVMKAVDECFPNVLIGHQKTWIWKKIG